MATNEASHGLGRLGSEKDCKVLIAVQPPAFERLIEHLLHGHPGLRVVGGSSRRDSAARRAARLAPDVIIASTRLHGKEHGDVLADLKRSCPASTLILLIDGLGERAPNGADAWLPEEAVVRRLLPVIRKVVARARDRAAEPAPAGRRAKRSPPNMSKSFRRSFVFAISMLVLPGALAFAAVTDSAVHAPPSYDTLVPPGTGASYTDPAFGSSVKRLSDAMNMTDNAGRGGLTSVSTEYSTASPFNSNNSRLILQHNSYFGLYDGNGSYLRDLPFAVNTSTEPRWSRTDPNVLFFVSGNNLMALDVASGAPSLVHAFGEYGAISGHGESDISQDGNHFVFAGDKRFVFVYEISTRTKGPVLDTNGHSFNNLYITPSNGVAIGWLPNGTARFTGVELFDRNMGFQRQLTHAIGHQHLTRDANGDDVLVWTNSNDPAPIACQNGIVKVRLSDAQQTCLLQLDWSLAVHITAPDGNGWAFVETYAPSNPFPSSSSWAPYTNEIVQVKLDGTEIRRLVHHRSRPFDSYAYQPRATMSRDGSRLVFTSNQNLQAILGYPNLYSDVYLVSVPGSATPSPAPAPSSEPAPAATPAPTPSSPAPAPATPPSTGASYFEQDGSAVTYAGSWSRNSLPKHSGASAKLSMDAGSRANFVFSGTGATWIGFRDAWSGIASVRVDGVLKGTLDSYSPSEQAQTILYTIGGLRNGPHTLTIEVTGTHSAASAGSWIWVDAFAVTR